ncbi:hypothetical protein SAMN06295888_105111 [Desulfonatronum zhilinae]|nr:hypothetical protein SAMN06295888_105111 [Desulfonatronum zhilinae]
MVQKVYGSVVGIPLCGTFILGVDEQCHAADLGRRPKASPTGGQEKLASETASLDRTVNGQPGQPEDRHLMTGQTASNQFRRPFKSQRGWGKAVETKNGCIPCGTDRQERLGPAEIMVFPGMTSEELVQRRLAAIKVIPAMPSINRLFMPSRNAHAQSGRASAARCSLLVGFGGFSSTSRT